MSYCTTIASCLLWLVQELFTSSFGSATSVWSLIRITKQIRISHSFRSSPLPKVRAHPASITVCRQNRVASPLQLRFLRPVPWSFSSLCAALSAITSSSSLLSSSSSFYDKSWLRKTNVSYTLFLVPTRRAWTRLSKRDFLRGFTDWLPTEWCQR